MSMGSGKRNGRPMSDYRMSRNRSYDKSMAFDGVYGNSRLMHAATSLIGCVVQVQVRDGSFYEGILRTFSPMLDIVLELAHKVTAETSGLASGLAPGIRNLVSSFPFQDGISDKLVFRLQDVVELHAYNVDTDFAVRDNFTDTAISRFNGQVIERELQPWEGTLSDGEDPMLSIDNEDGGENGWDANDMFRLNAEKYGVQTSYDNSLQEYTVALQRQDTEEWRLREARAARIAHEIEANSSHHTRARLENGDEEDKYSAVVRPSEDSTKYVAPQKRGKNVIRRLSPVRPSTLVKEPLNGDGSPTSIPPEESLIALPPPKPNQMLPPRIERRRETERKQQLLKQKGRTDEIEEFRKFSSNFKLTDDNKEAIDTSSENKLEPAPPLKPPEQQEPPGEDKSKAQLDISKSTLNPNAKSFTPRAVLPVSSPPVQQQQPQRIQAASPIIAAPQMVASMQPQQQQIFAANVMPQYVMQPYPQVATRFRKVPIAVQSRHDISPSMHAAVATGQPILAPANVQSHGGQIYATSMAPPQQHHTMGYPQMNFVMGPRVPQHVGVVPTTHAVSYCDVSHLPTHLIMSHGQSGQQAPSPVHQTPVFQQQFSPQPMLLMHQPHQHPLHQQSSTPPYVQQHHPQGAYLKNQSQGV